MTREEAIEILQGAIKKPNTKDGYLGQAIDMAIKALEQEPKTGHWEKTTDKYCYWYRCSCCGTKTPKTEWGNDYFSPYCPECGVKMVEPQESEEV